MPDDTVKPLTVPATVKFPPEVIVFVVPKNSMLPVEPEAKVTLPVPLADKVRFSLMPEERAETATPAPAAAPLMLSPVATEAIDASTLRTGLVVPFAPTAKALAEVEVIVLVPDAKLANEAAPAPDTDH